MLSAKRSVSILAQFSNWTNKIGHGRFRLGRDVPPATDSSHVACDDERQVEIRMRVAVAQSASIQDRGVIEQRAVSIGGRLQLLDKSDGN